jgi:hypothetical protein
MSLAKAPPVAGSSWRSSALALYAGSGHCTHHRCLIVNLATIRMSTRFLAPRGAHGETEYRRTGHVDGADVGGVLTGRVTASSRWLPPAVIGLRFGNGGWPEARRRA